MEGRERITLTSTFPEADGLGQVTRRDLKEIIVHAIRTDRGGREALFADARGGNWTSRFEVRRFGSVKHVTEEWRLRDREGNEFDIEAIDEVTKRGFNRFWWIYATRRAPRRERIAFRGFQAPSEEVRGFAPRGDGQRGFEERLRAS